MNRRNFLLALPFLAAVRAVSSQASPRYIMCSDPPRDSQAIQCDEYMIEIDGRTYYGFPTSTVGVYEYHE